MEVEASSLNNYWKIPLIIKVPLIDIIKFVRSGKGKESSFEQTISISKTFHVKASFIIFNCLGNSVVTHTLPFDRQT